MTYWATRTQWAVGQGGFHAACVEFCPNQFEPSGAQEEPCEMHAHPTFRYVYDCGEYGQSRSNVVSAVSAYGKELKGADLDILFISHAHADHTNAISDLFTTITGGKGRIKTIVLPLLDPLDRLIAFAQSSGREHAPVEGLALEILIDPAAALSPLARDVIFMVGTDGPPSDLDPVDPDDPDDPINNTLRGDDGDLGALVARLPFGLEGGLPTRKGQVVTLSHTVDILLKNPHRSDCDDDADDWCFKTFVDPAVFAQRVTFVTELKRRLQSKKLGAGRLVDKLTVAAMRELLTTYAIDLTAAYGAAITPKDVNVTSMSLYSGPKHSSMRRNGRLRIGTGIIPCGRAKGWLLTGDASLGVKARLDAFLQHFDGVKASVAVLTLPHHGSGHSFSEGLLGLWSSRTLYTTNANPPVKWQHPAARVVNAVSSIGARMHVVTDAAPSTIVFTAGNAESPIATTPTP